MATQPWYGIPIVEFQALKNYKAYRLECVVTLLLYRKGKNETQKIILHALLTKMIENKFG